MKRKEAKLKPLTARVPGKLIERLKFLALREHTSVQALVTEAVESLLQQRRKEGK